ncbi:hypothetical protein CHUAL_010871 [Chamberlinius hualienensis]
MNMADGKQVRKGILKSSSSFEKTEPYRCGSKEMKWDEMNILQTLHPADKDYGHMKIEEPKTPYSHYKDPDEMQLGNVEPHSDDEIDSFDANLLAKKIQIGSNELPKALEENDEDEDSDEEFKDETAEEREKRKFFEQKRKLHYNEFYAVKLARKLMEKEEDVDEDDDENDQEAVTTTKDESETNEQLQKPDSTECESCNHNDILS